jgi:hypothetical protein
VKPAQATLQHPELGEQPGGSAGQAARAAGKALIAGPQSARAVGEARETGSESSPLRCSSARSSRSRSKLIRRVVQRRTDAVVSVADGPAIDRVDASKRGVGFRYRLDGASVPRIELARRHRLQAVERR